jgi:hypothetical protein
MLPANLTLTALQPFQVLIDINGSTSTYTFSAAFAVPSQPVAVPATLTAAIISTTGQTLPFTNAAAFVTFFPPGTTPLTSQILRLTTTPPQPSITSSSTEVVLSRESPSSPYSQLTSDSGTAVQTSSFPTATSQPEHVGYGVGELVGAAMGCLVGGVLIATAALCLLMRRKVRKRNGASGPDREKLPLRGDDRAVYIAGSKGWESHLPQSESDGTIRNMANRTLDQIEMYVENFYKDTINVNLSPEVQSKITELDSRHLPGPIRSLLPQSSRPTVLIKHSIANLVVSSIAAGEATNGSFLPKDFSSLQLSSTTQRKPGRMSVMEKVFSS